MMRSFIQFLTAPFAGMLLLFGLFPQSRADAEPPREQPLRITPQNTLILDGSNFAGRVLQHYLIRAFAGTDAARPYLPDANIDRAAAPHFPVLVEKNGMALPEDKLVLAVGNTRFLTPDDRSSLSRTPAPSFSAAGVTPSSSLATPSLARLARRAQSASFWTSPQESASTHHRNSGTASPRPASSRSARSSSSGRSSSRRASSPRIGRITPNGCA